MPARLVSIRALSCQELILVLWIFLENKVTQVTCVRTEGRTIGDRAPVPLSLLLSRCPIIYVPSFTISHSVAKNKHINDILKARGD